MKTKTPHPNHRIAAIVASCRTKKELAAHLKGTDLAEAWRMMQVRESRRKRLEVVIDNCRYNQSIHEFLSPEPMSEWMAEGLKPMARAAAFSWPMRDVFSRRFLRRLAKKIKAGWSYDWRGVEYALSMRHTRKPLSVVHSRSASGYTDFFTTLAFNVIDAEAVWIGGLLTVRAKSDRRKSAYPCQWLERRKDSPGLIVRTGRIVRRNFHEEDATAVEVRRAQGAAKRNAKRTKPPAGWVSRQSSIDAGNCASGTDHFINNRLRSYLETHGVSVGSLDGAAIRKTLLLEVERSAYTARLK